MPPLTGLLLAILMLATASPAAAQHALKITHGDGPEVTLTLEDLDAMEQLEFTTSTIWTDAPQTLSGVPLLSVIKGALGVDAPPDGRLALTALNDYQIEIPVAELGPQYPIVATRAGGAPMPVRERGPYWVVYPFDSDPAFQTSTVYARAIWQLAEISVLE